MKPGKGISKVAKMLRKRKVTLTALAKQAGVSRPHLSECLAGKPGRGGVVRGRVSKFLQDDELRELGWVKATTADKATAGNTDEGELD